MIVKKIITTLCLICSICVAYSQSSIDALIKEWERAKAYTKEYLEAMPESGYSLKPTKEMRSFAEQMLHLAEDNFIFISAATGETNPVKDLEKGTTDKSKANVTKLAMESYDYVIASLKKMTLAKLNEKITLFGRFEVTRQVAIEKDFEHQTHHRGQSTVYLRLAGVTPPQEKLF